VHDEHPENMHGAQEDSIFHAGIHFLWLVFEFSEEPGIR
jgi:hypothetical protein